MQDQRGSTLITTTLIIAIIAIGIVALLGLARSHPPAAGEKAKQATPKTSVTTSTSAQPQVAASDDKYYAVIRVVDGDTLHVNVNGQDEDVRLIGVDTPETVDPGKPEECYGKQASDYMKNLLSGKSVRLESDASQGSKDKYSRYLYYVFLPDGSDVDETLIQGGYGHEYTYSNPYKYQAAFKQAQQEAQANGRGLWAANTCNGNTGVGSKPI